jgi:DNA-binding GntR family transcriptional regulator
LNGHINQKSLVEHITNDLEDKINRGTIKPGERIIEEVLCKTYGVSRSPVREALRVLESQGYVTREPRKGVSVSKVTAKDIEDTYRIRANLESLAVYLAVKRQDPKVLRQLKVIHQKMIQLADQKTNMTAYFNLNLKFHKILVDACGNQRLIQMIDTFVKQTKRYRFKVLSLPGRLRASLKKHEMIIQSFEKGDAEKAEALRKETILINIYAFDDQPERNETERNDKNEN